MKLIISQQACGCAGLARGQAELAFRLLLLLFASLTFGISAVFGFNLDFRVGF
jgi:hypothetical protein